MSASSSFLKVLSRFTIVFLLLIQFAPFPTTNAENRGDPSISILHPSDGKTLEGMVTISWKAYNLEDTGHFILYVVDDNNKTFELDNIDCEDGNGTYDYNWDTTRNDPLLQHKIRVEYYEDNHGFVCSEETDEYFELTPPTVTVIIPNGGEILSETIRLKWSVSYITEDGIFYLYYSDDGYYWTEIDDFYVNEDETTFSYNWSVKYVDLGNNFKIKVEYKDYFDNSFSDESNSVFTIEPPPCLDLNFLNGVTVKPSGVVIFFSAQTCEGEPVTDMEATDFTVYEDSSKVSVYESQQTILNKEVGFDLSTILLLDMSGSIIESGQLPTLQEAAKGFIDKVAEEQKTGIFLFDGREEIEQWAALTNNKEDLKARIDDLSNYQVQDPSTNLNGAIIKGLAQLGGEDFVTDKTYQLKVGSLVVFTDGTDQASRNSNWEAQNAVLRSEHNVFTIGLGGEIDEEHLQNLGENGFEFADDTENVTAAFNKIAERIKKASQKFYVLAYCSPKRAGDHIVTLDGDWKGSKETISYDFNADGFESGCNPFTIESDLSILQGTKNVDDRDNEKMDSTVSEKERETNSIFFLAGMIGGVIVLIIIITIILVVSSKKKKRKRGRNEPEYSSIPPVPRPPMVRDTYTQQDSPQHNPEHIQWSEPCPRCGSQMNPDIQGGMICTLCGYRGRRV